MGHQGKVMLYPAADGTPLKGRFTLPTVLPLRKAEAPLGSSSVALGHVNKNITTLITEDTTLALLPLTLVCIKQQTTILHTERFDWLFIFN